MRPFLPITFGHSFVCLPLPGPSFERHHGEQCQHRLRYVVEVELVVEPTTFVGDRFTPALLVHHVLSPGKNVTTTDRTHSLNSRRFGPLVTAVRISKVTQRQAWSAPRWDDLSWVHHLAIYATSHSGQLSLLPSEGCKMSRPTFSIHGINV